MPRIFYHTVRFYYFFVSSLLFPQRSTLAVMMGAQDAQRRATHQPSIRQIIACGCRPDPLLIVTTRRGRRSLIFAKSTRERNIWIYESRGLG
ncbi:hypothetical protein B0H19DRAFT_1102480 [Mycena capillaripes]|nr:hypothetical protein B0H19DRAFT_1102480 [Mycena capillaripes]